MLTSFLVWIYLVFHAFVWGNFFYARFIEVERKKYNANVFLIILIGIVWLAAYTQIFHFFARLDWVAHLTLNLSTAAMTVLEFKHLKVYFNQLFNGIKKISRPIIFGGLVLALVFLIQSSASPAFYDTDLYHAQTVKWAENHKVVVGLGNLYSAFALNSIVFTLHALGSFSFLLGQSLHAVNGLVILLLCLFCYRELISFSGKEKRWSIYKLFSLFYLLFLLFHPFFSEFAASLYPDITANIYAFLCVLLLVKDFERGKVLDQTIKLIWLFTIFIFTAKLSLGFLLLMNLFFWRFYFQKRTNFLYALGIAILIVIPYLIKTYLLSGYLLYPIVQLDIFNVDWKMSKTIVVEEMAWIRSWSRIPELDYHLVLAYPLREWLPRWLALLPRADFLLIISLLFTPILIYFQFLLHGFKQLLRNHRLYLNLYAWSLLGMIFWLYSAPDMRFGYVFLLTPFFLVIALFLGKSFFPLLNRNLNWSALKKFKKYYPTAQVISILLFGLIFFLREPYIYKLKDVFKFYLVLPADYGNYASEYEIINGVTYYYPKDINLMGYDLQLPATPYLNRNIKLRGDELKYGFRLEK